MGKKVLCVIRVSTEKQEITDQKNEMLQFCKDNGYSENDIIFLEGIGASAIKLNQKYLDMIDSIEDYINKGIVESVAVWHINRLGRNDDVLIRLKNFYIAHKVQFLCKNPTLRLLNEDGSVNAGSELAYSLFATMCKQDMEEKKAKFKRAKKGKLSRGQYVGGYYNFGYKLDENNFIVEDKHDADLVRMIFDMYASGKYSLNSLCQELKDRGITYTNTHCAKPVTNYSFSKDHVHIMLQDKAYIGEKTNVKYPPIVSKEVFDKCQAVAKRNNVHIDRSKKYYFATKIIMCPCCGNYMYGNLDRYVCWRHDARRKGYLEESCPNDAGIRIDVLDGLLWNIAASLHMDYLLSLSKDSIAEYQEQMGVLKQKIDAAQGKIDSIQGKKKKIIDTYLEELITKEERDRRLSKVDSESAEYKNTIETLKSDYNALKKQIETSDTDMQEVERMMTTMNDVIDETDEKKMYDIVHRHIKSVKITRFDFGHAYRRGDHATKPNALNIDVVTASDILLTFAFLPYVRTKHNLYKKDGDNWAVYDCDRIRRDSGSAYTSFTEPELTKKLKDVQDSAEHKELMKRIESLENE